MPEQPQQQPEEEEKHHPIEEDKEIVIECRVQFGSGADKLRETRREVVPSPRTTKNVASRAGKFAESREQNFAAEVPEIVPELAAEEDDAASLSHRQQRSI